MSIELPWGDRKVAQLVSTDSETSEALSGEYVNFEDETGKQLTSRNVSVKINSATGELIGIGSKLKSETSGTNFVTYNESLESFPNPERGWFHYTETHWTSAAGAGHNPLVAAEILASRNGTTSISGADYSHRSIVFRYYVMEYMRDVDTIPAAYLKAIAADAAVARSVGVKLIPRFAYSTSGKMTAPYGADTTPARTLSHIQQLASTINANADVISAVQTGFIGMWGEWFYTDNWGDVGTVTTAQWNSRAQLITEMLKWDSRIQILIRYPGIKHRYITEGSGTGWTAPEGASKRLGFHNDAFLADDAGEDWGTYNTFTNNLSVAQLKAYLAAESKRPLMLTGETAGVSSRSTMPNAGNEMQQYRWSSLNPHYHPDVLGSWSQSEKDEVGKKLGYRIRLISASFPSMGSVNERKSFSLTLSNDGWSAPISARPMQLVFVGDKTTVTRTLTTNSQSIGSGIHKITESVELPDTVGEWSVHLAIPDPSLPTRSEYAIRLANNTLWDNGRNSLGVTVKTV